MDNTYCRHIICRAMRKFTMQQSYINLVRKYGMKYISILLFWVLCLMFILKIYSQEYTYMENSTKIKRDSNNTNFRMGLKFLENFSQTVDFPELQLDTDTHDPLHEDLVMAIETELPSLPFRFWYWNEDKKLQMSPNCSKFPDLFHLNYYNKYWQTFQVENITLQLYSAYYDDRPTLVVGTKVRLLAMINSTEKSFPNIYCQLWYDEQLKPVITKVSFRMIWYTTWGSDTGQLYPYLVTCQIPANATQLIPKVVSLVSNECETAANSLRVHYDKPQAPNVKRQFAVCVKGLDYPNLDISARLIEWIELQQILGASKIFFYQLEVHPNVSKVLQYYAERGVIDVRPITLATGEPNTPQMQHYLLHMRIHTKRLNELIPYNDCFYRNLYNYDYIALEDIDEVLMPLGNHTSWSDLVELAAKNRTENCKYGFASYCFVNVYFPEFTNKTGLIYHPTAVPSYMHMLTHVQRSSENLGNIKAIKCLHRTSKVMTLHNHFPLSWLNVCPAFFFEAKDAQMHHYRHEDKQENLTESVEDMNIWRFKNVLLERSFKVFQELNFFKNGS